MINSDHVRFENPPLSRWNDKNGNDGVIRKPREVTDVLYVCSLNIRRCIEDKQDQKYVETLYLSRWNDKNCSV